MRTIGLDREIVYPASPADSNSVVKSCLSTSALQQTESVRTVWVVWRGRASNVRKTITQQLECVWVFKMDAKVHQYDDLEKRGECEL